MAAARVTGLAALLALAAAAAATTPARQDCTGSACPRMDESQEVGSADAGVTDSVVQLVKGQQEVRPSLPGGTEVTAVPRSLDQGELSVGSKLDSSEARRRKKGKLRKLIVPLAVFLALKALTLIPLFLGLLGVKAFNALQLGFGSFVVSFGMAIYQLCKKLMGDSMPPPPITPYVAAQPIVAAPTGWDRSAHDSAYSAYAPASR